MSNSSRERNNDTFNSELASLRLVPAKQLIQIMLMVLQAHNNRRSELLRVLLADLQQPNREDLKTFWQDLKRSATPEDALYLVTHWIGGKLDGADLSMLRTTKPT